MARVNIGIEPKYLSDQHLLAESVEITMITGQLRQHNYTIKGDIPPKFPIGKGHMTFFKNKLLYLYKRLNEVNKELTRRNFNPGTNINLSEFPCHLISDWNPSIEESLIIRERVVDRLKNPLKAKPDFHRYYSIPLKNINDWSENIIKSQLFYV